MRFQPGRGQGESKIDRLFRKPGKNHSLQHEKEIALGDQDKLEEDVETEILRTRQVLTKCVAIAVHRTLAAMNDRGESPDTGQLADLAYAVACLEAGRHGALPSNPPPKISGEPPSSNMRTTTPRGAAQWGTGTR
ncbi:hypothetical protein A9W98_31530 [Mycobacterium gordonae]|jgi:hypothetical protein|uniref:Uncharacterized protein n=1 Tax=Mycobacterium gordonae TaxID=1778 RepID=A0A1A6BA57_MYCGO|nr:hypothetical protein A9W98_31530 [Mycobacterium gordonae]